MSQENIPGPDVALGLKDTPDGSSKKPALASQAAHHPSGKAGHGTIVKFLRGLAFTVYFWSCVLVYVELLLENTGIFGEMGRPLANNLLQYWRHAADWRTPLLCQQRNVLRIHGHDQAIIFSRHHCYDQDLGANHDSCQRRRVCCWSDQEDARRHSSI